VADKYFDNKKNPNLRPENQKVIEPVAIPLPTPAVPRSFKTAFDPAFLAEYHKGTMNYTYKGVSCLKDPIDSPSQGSNHRLSAGQL
jgi:hypothetical protein